MQFALNTIDEPKRFAKINLRMARRMGQDNISFLTPSSDLIVSPQHRVLVRSKIAERMFGSDEVLIAAKRLSEIDGIDVVEGASGVVYFHLLFDRHEIVTSNGAESESLYTGLQALKSIGGAARKKIFALFPEISEIDYQATSCRPFS